ncbi:hypothetical protein JN11_01346 [Mucilaginibacter frigoritolerans]|uniref:Uncharacterized protein n=1 Tax=Mucilaginibacter frigoritolerans TaxID=652788 RepID=A0A562U999_9SPHI|nr:hypothetical protein [Mucilaginibacter frigoritolerans]TWJ02374.1 hypothetical protein JN11_01346 [Mucilaginibacter frigoritolerans]
MEKLSFVLLQAASSEIVGYLISAVFIILFLFAVFLVTRVLVLWYWKVDVIVRNQEEQTALIKYQNQLTEYQTKVLKEFIEQTHNIAVGPNK